MTSIYGGRTSRPDLAVLADVRQRNAALVQRAVMPSDDDAHDRLIGCVLGLAVGDVLGCPVEGLRFRDIQRRYGSVGGLLIPEYGRHWRLPGLHSDDTQQALAVLIALERDGRPRSGAGAAAPDRQIAERLASLYVRGMQADVRAAFGCWRGTGRNFRSAVSRMSKDGHAPGAQGLVGSITQRLGFNQRATTWPFGYGEPSAGLGAVMRIPPLGVAATGDSFEALARLVAAVTLITHTHPLAVVSAAAAAFASRLLVDCQHDTFSPDQFLADLSARVRSLEEHLPSVLGEGEYAVQSEQQTTLVSTLITAVAGLVRIEPATVMRDLAERSAAATGRRTHPTEGFAPVGVAACLYFFAHDAGDPAAALLAAINAGGDTDTIGAIVGAFSGALYGPAAFRQFLPDLVALESIIRTANGERVDLIAEETRLTRLEEEIKARLAETVARRMNGGSAMNQQPRNSGWVEDDPPAPGTVPTQPSGQSGGTASRTGRRPAKFDPQDLTTLPGVTKLDQGNVPADVIDHTQSGAFTVRQYYQVDDVPRWRAWRDLLTKSGGEEQWVFYGCPPTMAEEVLGDNEPAPYGEFFPRVFGQHALYLFRRASDAARATFKFGTANEGYLLSCRLVTGATFRTKQANPQADAPPQGRDTVIVPKGTDLGFGVLRGDMYVAFDPARMLTRYITHIERPSGG